MPTITVHLAVKFRALGITFGNWSQDWNIPLPEYAGVIAANRSLLTFNKQGVDLIVTLKA